MIKKIIKNRRDIAKGVVMVSAVYALIVVNSVRMAYGRNTTSFSRDY